ncbi:MAG: hypothetical protein WCC59_09605, partial [Terriglobales bacterium]
MVETSRFGGEKPLRLVRRIVELCWSAFALERGFEAQQPITDNSFCVGKKTPGRHWPGDFALNSLQALVEVGRLRRPPKKFVGPGALAVA